MVEKSSNILSIFISQSGETADTLAALRYAKENKSKILSLVNVTESSISRESDFVLSIAAGPEIGVASTKAFSAQLSILACLCLVMARKRKKINKNKELIFTESLLEIPSRMSSVMDSCDYIKKYVETLLMQKAHYFLEEAHYFQ